MGFAHGPALRRIKPLIDGVEREDDDAAIAKFVLTKRRLNELGLSFDKIIKADDQWPDTACETSRARLKKILSLTASDKDGESIAAFLMARRLSARLNIPLSMVLDFGDAEGRSVASAYSSEYAETLVLRKEIERLRQKISDMDVELTRYKAAFNALIETTWEAAPGQDAVESNAQTTHRRAQRTAQI